MALGIVASLLKGLAWREALLLSGIAGLLLPSRSYFQRHSSLLRMPFSKSWLSNTAMVLGGSLWLGFFAHRNVNYANEMWWQFSYDANAPRFLRAWLVLAIISVAYGLWRLLSVVPVAKFTKPTPHELSRAQELLIHAGHTQGFLALLGDKILFWNSEQTAFIMKDFMNTNPSLTRNGSPAISPYTPACRCRLS